MNWYRSADGEQRIWYEHDEIEDIAADELRRAELFPTLEAPVVDLEKFIESYLHAKLDQYAVLPADVLGSTEFEPGAPPRVHINRDLTKLSQPSTSPAPAASGGGERRWRMRDPTSSYIGCSLSSIQVKRCSLTSRPRTQRDLVCCAVSIGTSSVAAVAIGARFRPTAGWRRS